ncbi:MAG: hypothetical protein HRT77_00530 [Halioglobus sp.]|nr:hypothetical protein [Halioglobus sp.]
MSGSVHKSGLALIWLVLSSACYAADEGRAYRVLAINSVETCSDLNTAVAIANEEDDWRLLYTFSLYTMGYLTGVNRLAYDTYDIAGGKNVKTHMVWLQRYCAENPRVDFSEALHQLVIQLYPRRLIAEPG